MQRRALCERRTFHLIDAAHSDLGNGGTNAEINPENKQIFAQRLILCARRKNSTRIW